MDKPTTLSFPEVDWSHPAFEGRRAIVIVGGKPVTKGKGERDYVANASAGTLLIDASAKGTAWHGTGVGTKLNLSRVLGEHASALVIMGSGSIRTNRSGSNNYIGYSYLNQGGVQFGTGGAPGPASRRSWSWTTGNVCCIVPHATSMSTAPMVYVDGAKRIPTDIGGSGTTFSWGTASTDTHEVGYDPGNPTVNQNDRVVLAVFFSGALPEALAKSLSENPWQLFKQNAPALYLSGAASGTTVAPGAGGYTFAGNTPTISQPHTVSPAAGAVVALGYAPSLVQGVSVAPGTGAAAYAGHAPSIAQPHTVAPSAGAVVALGYAPSIQQAAGIYPGAGEVVYTGQAPTVSQPHTVSPGVGAYDILGYAPTVFQAAGVAPLAGSIIVLGYAPSIAQPHTVAPGAGAAAWLGYEPTISQIASSFTEAQLQEILAYVEANMAVPTANEIATAVWQMVLEGALTAEQIMRIKLAALAGKRQGLGTATEAYLAQDGVTPRVTFTPTDAAGNGATVVDGA